MQTHSLRTFYWVTRLNSFRGAAEVLNISQPTVSARIRGLEEELGVTLLLRDQDLALTEQGEELLEYTRKVLRLTEDLSFHRGTDVTESRLRLGANGPVAATWLMPMVDRLEKEFPALRIEIEVNRSSLLLRHLAAGQLEVAFVSGQTRDPALRLDLIGAFPMIWAGKPDLFPPWISTEELGRQPIVGYSWDSPIHDLTHVPAFGPGRHRRFAQSDSLFMMIRLAIEGAGLVLAPEPALKREIGNGELKKIETEIAPSAIPIFAARTNTRVSKFADKAIEIARRQFEPE